MRGLSQLRQSILEGLAALDGAGMSDTLREQLRCAGLMALGAVEDELGVPRSFASRRERRRRRNARFCARRRAAE